MTTDQLSRDEPEPELDAEPEPEPELDAEPEPELDAELDAELDDEPDDDEPEPDDGDMFPRSYIEKLRSKQYHYRHRAQRAERRAELLARELFRSRVADLDVLADPDDLDYSDELLDDGDALRAAVSELVERKPHLRARRAAGSLGLHEPGSAGDGFTLTEVMRRHA